MKNKIFVLLCIIFLLSVTLIGCNEKNSDSTYYYNLAVEYGFQGSEAEFSEQLKTIGASNGRGVLSVTEENGILIIELIDGNTYNIDIKGKDGIDGVKGNDGQTPYIGDNGNWWIGEQDTGVLVQDDPNLTVRLNDFYNIMDTIVNVKKGECIDLPTPVKARFL